MKKDNIIKTLMIIIIILSMGMIGVSAKLISVEKNKVDYDVSKEIENILQEIEKLKEEKEIVEEPIIDKPPIEKEPVVETPEKENPIKKEPEKEKPKEEKLPDKKEDKEIITAKFISIEEAIEIALKKVGPGGRLVEIESDLDDNPPKYELEIILGNYEYELEIHAITGAIIDFEKDEID